MTNKELKKLKDKLPAGYRERLATGVSVSVGTVDKVFAGERQNIKLIKKAIELAKEHQEELSHLSTEIKKL